MNNKFFIILLALLAGSGISLQAQPKNSYERPPVILFRDGNIGGYVGHDVRVTYKQDVHTENGELVFNGTSSMCRFGIPWLYPGEVNSISYVADVKLDELPSKQGGAICGRSGWHSGLFVSQDGTVSFGTWGLDNKASVSLRSKTRLKPGKWYRIAGTQDCSYDNKSVARLYINGTLECEEAFVGPARIYERAVNVGSINVDIRSKTAVLPLKCRIKNFYYYYKALNATEIVEQPGLEQEKKDWVICKPVVSLGRQHIGAPVKCDLKTPSKAITVDIRFSFDQEPPNRGMIFLRPGFDNGLEYHDGRIRMMCWNAEETQEGSQYSKTRFVPGREYNVRWVIEERGVETLLTLYVDGKREIRTAITGRCHPYGRDIFFGGMPNRNGGAYKTLEYNLIKADVYNMALYE